jgi:hypothetical protein
MGSAALEYWGHERTLIIGRNSAFRGISIQTIKKATNMRLRPQSKLIFAATLGLAFFGLVAHAQLINVNVSQQGTFGPFTGGTNNVVTNNGSTNTTEVISTGTPVASPFSITYNPLSGPSTVALNTSTLNTSTFVLHSTVGTPLNYFTSVGITLTTDFDSGISGAPDLTQNYTLDLSPYTAANGFTGISYLIVPQQFTGVVDIGGLNYQYASVVSGNSGVLFDGSSTTAAIQFQFLSNPVTAVPEPSTYALLGVLALGGIVLFRRRSKGDTMMTAMPA